MKRIGCVCLLVAASLGSSPAFAGGGGGLCPAPTRSTTGSRVVMQQYCYKPADLSVRPGSEVTFLNDDEALHTVTSSGTSHGLEMKFEKGEWTTVRFTIPGVYTYRCDLHPFMVGVIRVGSASAAGASEGVTVVRSGPDPRANVPDDFSIPNDPPAPTVVHPTALRTAGFGLAGFVPALGLVLFGVHRRRRRTT